MAIFGIDVSHHQGPKLDWGLIKGAGLDFMFARASLADVPDEHFHKNLTRAVDAGFEVVGAYHFLYPAQRVPIAKQVATFLDQVKVPKGKLMMLDVEKDKGGVKPQIDDVRAFAEAFATATDGHPLLMYAPAWYWDRIGDPDASDLGKLVASLYVRVDLTKTKDGRLRCIKMTPTEAFARVPKRFWTADHGGWKRPTILQFTSCGKVPGHRAKVDFNAFRGTMDQLAALARKAPAGAPVVVDPPDDPTLVDPSPAMFHVVKQDDTIIGIAAAFGWQRNGDVPAFRVMLKAFAENEPFRAHPELIHKGDRIRVG